MNWLRDVVAWALRSFFGLLLRVKFENLDDLSKRGPLILYANHINSVEVPVMLSNLHPRPIIGFAKAESWRNPAFNLLFSLFHAIPVRRGEADLAAMQQALKDLAAGNILVIAPEGTRSYHGKLQKGLPGIGSVMQNPQAVNYIKLTLPEGKSHYVSLYNMRERMLSGFLISLKDAFAQVQPDYFSAHAGSNCSISSHAASRVKHQFILNGLSGQLRVCKEYRVIFQGIIGIISQPLIPKACFRLLLNP